jgi:hypothetical protein
MNEFEPNRLPGSSLDFINTTDNQGELDFIAHAYLVEIVRTGTNHSPELSTIAGAVHLIGCQVFYVPKCTWKMNPKSPTHGTVIAEPAFKVALGSVLASTQGVPE